MRMIFGILLLTLTAVAAGAPDGGQLYAAHCAVCHGDKGDGGVGVPLALASFLDSVDDGFLRKSIRHGRPGRVMPAFSKLSDAQLDAIVRHIRGWSDKPSPVFSREPVEGDPLHGEDLFAAYCTECHGEYGEGGKGTGVTFSRQRDLPIIAPALGNSGFLSAASDAMIKRTLMYGREGTPMMSYLDQGLSEQDINDLVSYVRLFSVESPATYQDEHAAHDPVIVAESPYALEETVENLKDAIVSQNFLLIRAEYLEHGLVEEGMEDTSQVVLHFCNFRLLYEAMAVDPRVGTFLPCRVTVVEKDGKVKVMTINPIYLSRVFNNQELYGLCEQMSDVYRNIIEDATL